MRPSRAASELPQGIMRSDRGKRADLEKTFPVFSAKNRQVNRDFNAQRSIAFSPRRVHRWRAILQILRDSKVVTLEVDAVFDTIALHGPPGDALVYSRICLCFFDL